MWFTACSSSRRLASLRWQRRQHRREFQVDQLVHHGELHVLQHFVRRAACSRQGRARGLRRSSFRCPSGCCRVSWASVRVARDTTSAMFQSCRLSRFCQTARRSTAYRSATNVRSLGASGAGVSAKLLETNAIQSAPARIWKSPGENRANMCSNIPDFCRKGDQPHRRGTIPYDLRNLPVESCVLRLRCRDKSEPDGLIQRRSGPGAATGATRTRNHGSS